MGHPGMHPGICFNGTSPGENKLMRHWNTLGYLACGSTRHNDSTSPTDKNEKKMPRVVAWEDGCGEG